MSVIQILLQKHLRLFILKSPMEMIRLNGSGTNIKTMVAQVKRY